VLLQTPPFLQLTPPSKGKKNETVESSSDAGQTSHTGSIPSLVPVSDPTLRSTGTTTHLPSDDRGQYTENTLHQIPIVDSSSHDTPSRQNQPLSSSRRHDDARPGVPAAEGSAFIPRRTADSFFDTTLDADHVLPVVEPKRSNRRKPALEDLAERYSHEEWEKRFTRELSRLDRHHGPDLKSSMLSALFTTLPVLVLYYIHSLPFRLLAVILFTLVFAVGLSLTYRPKRGEVFATTAA
jgi:hypothetical protein